MVNSRKKKDTTDEDIVIEDTLDGKEDTPLAVANSLKKTKEKLKQCEKEKRDYLSQLQRERAEFINSRKRDEASLREAKEYATLDVIESLLPVCDSFAMAMRDEKTWNSVDENWRKGIEYIYSQLKAVLENYGVERIEALGQPIDHRLHEALESVSVAHEADDHRVVAVLQEGYRKGERIIRPAKVRAGIFEKLDEEK